MWYDYLEGVKLTRENAGDLAKWVGGEVHETRTDGKQTPMVSVPTNRGDILIRLGDWVTRDKEGRPRVLRIKQVNIKDLTKSKSGLHSVK